MEADTVAQQPIVDNTEEKSSKKRKRKSEKVEKKKKRKSTAEPSESPSSPKKEKKSKKEKKDKKDKSSKKKKSKKVISDEDQPVPEPIKVIAQLFFVELFWFLSLQEKEVAMPNLSKEEVEALKSNVNSGINFDQYDNIPIEVFPSVFEPVEKFADAKLGAPLQRIIDLIGEIWPSPIA